MISHPSFSVDPWRLRETGLDLSVLAQSESIFALSNGHIGWRGNLDEGEPHGMPGSYLNGLHEIRDMPHAEAGIGSTKSRETMINVTNGKLIRLLVDDEPFDVREGELRAHERVLDFRSGTLDRRVEWVSPAGSAILVTSRRMVSFTQRAVAAISYQVEPVSAPTRVVVQSELVANEQLPGVGDDPRKAAALAAPLWHEEDSCRPGPEGQAILIHRTRETRLRVAAAMEHEVHCPAGIRHLTESREDAARLTVSTLLQPGQRLRVVKYIAFGWSGIRSIPALRDQVEGALSAARLVGWDGLLAEQRGYLEEFWDRADVQLDGDEEIQQAVRFGMFHVLQAGARAEGRAIPAKGLTGTGYEGHAFWDTETYVLPVLTYTVPSAAAAALTWRHSTLPRARERAGVLGLSGAAFPWRTIDGHECSGNWPVGLAAFHINADIADAVVRYVHASGDEQFGAGAGLDLLVETARLWLSLGHFDSGGQFHIDGVTGPDEYSALADDNVYTNLMAQHNLSSAAAAVLRYPERAATLGAGPAEADAWSAAARAMAVPYDEALGVHPQAEGFTGHEEWDFAATPAGAYPLLLHYPYFDLYRKQVVKQADLVLAMQLRPDAFTAEQKVRNFAYYERLTVRDSSLSACRQAVMAAEVGSIDLAYDYLAEAALTDISDVQHNTGDGVHIAALAGSWIALVWGFGGMRHRDGTLSFTPRLPGSLARLLFRVSLGGRLLEVEFDGEAASYRLTGEGPPLALRHHDEDVVVMPGDPVRRPIPALPRSPRPAQPPGREPARRQSRTGPGG